MNNVHTGFDNKTLTGKSVVREGNMTNKQTGQESCDGKDLIDALYQIHAVNKLADKGIIKECVRLRTHNKIRKA